MKAKNKNIKNYSMYPFILKFKLFFLSIKCTFSEWQKFSIFPTVLMFIARAREKDHQEMFWYVLTLADFYLENCLNLQQLRHKSCFYDDTKERWWATVDWKLKLNTRNEWVKLNGHQRWNLIHHVNVNPSQISSVASRTLILWSGFVHAFSSSFVFLWR